MTSLMCGLLLTIVGAAPQSQPAATASTDYVVGADDVLMITVYDEQGLTGKYTVDVGGGFTFPLLGRLDVGGKTLRQVEDDLTKRLKGGYLVNPQVSVVVDQYRSQTVYITGEVRNPGGHPIKGPTSVVQALMLAGSPTDTAADEMLIIRSKDPKAAKGPLKPEDEGAETETVNLNDVQSGKLMATVVRDGDTIMVPKASKFYVQGHVRNPGTYTLTPGLTVRQALVMAGGLDEHGTERGVRIVRSVTGKEREIKVRLDDLVQANDTITVRQRFF